MEVILESITFYETFHLNSHKYKPHRCLNKLELVLVAQSCFLIAVTTEQFEAQWQLIDIQFHFLKYPMELIVEIARDEP